ncbi:transmembrane transporter [Aureococcus anophagefferens]|nr:transmembrane transporter [Aureococcus anophagefferens]
MVGLGARSSAAPASRFRYVAANGLFLVNCTASSAYVILSKGAAPDAPTVSVTFRTYLRAAALMVLTTTVVNASGPLLAVVCDDCGRRGAWRVPARALWALAYWVLGQSVVAYCLVTWATRRASSTLVSAFAVVQPVVAAALTAAILAAGAYANCATSADDDACLAPTGWPALGAVPIFAGLFLVVRTEAPPAPPAPLAHPLLLAGRRRPVTYGAPADAARSKRSRGVAPYLAADHLGAKPALHFLCATSEDEAERLRVALCQADSGDAADAADAR